MIRALAIATMLALAGTDAAPLLAQEAGTVSGTRLEIVATGEVSRVPDLALVNAGVVTQAPNATEALGANARQMTAVRAALRRAGITERDIQTASVDLQPEWRHVENAQPQLVGYRARNMLRIRFRDLANAGRVIDALVASGANQIDGPTLTIDRPEEALNEARAAALKAARTRADLYARALGMRVSRILLVSEAGAVAGPRPMAARAEFAMAAADATNIVPGEQLVSATLTVSFELQ